MEDCFVAAQRGELQIKPSDFDLLLRSVDLLVRIAEATKDAEPHLEQLSDEVHDCVEQLKCLREGRPHSTTAATAATVSVTSFVGIQPVVFIRLRLQCRLRLRQLRLRQLPAPVVADANAD